jgi:hypothetical protein
MTNVTNLLRYGWAAVCLLLAAVFAFGTGAVISPLLLAVSAFMTWTRQFELQAAKGNRVIGSQSRVLVAASTAALAIFLLPGDAPKAPAEAETGKAVREAATTEMVEAAISGSEARELCEGPIRQQLTHPSTADFNTFGSAIVPRGDRSATYAIGLTAKTASAWS